MGESTNAILVYGFELDEDSELLEEGEEDWDEYVESRIDDAKNPPVELVHHCSHDYTMWIIAVPGTEITARRGGPVPIDIGKLEIDPAKFTAFMEWCDEHLTFAEEEKPGWILCSYRG